MKLKQRPEDFQVTESWRFDEDPKGQHFVYLMDKQKLSTFEAVERICAQFKIPRAAVSYCGLKDKQGRTTQLLAIHRRQIELQDPDLRLKPLGRAAGPLSAANTTSNRFAVTVRDLSEEDVARLTASIAEVRRLGVVNYFDSQRFGSLKHGQGFIVKDLMRGDFEVALRNVLARPSELDHSDDARVKTFWKEHWGEWDRRNPYPGAERYEAVVRWLRKNPGDYRGALLRTEPRWRALQVFAYQSWLWNEGVKQYLKDVVGMPRLVSVRYQAGSLLFPRELDASQARLLARADLSAPRARDAVLGSGDGEGGAVGAPARGPDALRPRRARHARDPLRPRGAAHPGVPRPPRGRRGEARRAEPRPPAGERGVHAPARRVRHARREAALPLDARPGPEGRCAPGARGRR